MQTSSSAHSSSSHYQSATNQNEPDSLEPILNPAPTLSSSSSSPPPPARSSLLKSVCCCFYPSSSSSTQSYKSLDDSPIYKNRTVALYGLYNTGKTSIVRCFSKGTFSEHYTPSITHSSTFGQSNLSCEIIDTSGRDEYDNFSSATSIDVHGFILVFSICEPQSIVVAQSLNSKICNAKGYPPPRVLVATHCDLENQRAISRETCKNVAQKLGVPLIECSSKTGANIDLIFQNIITQIEAELNPRSSSSCVLL